MPFFKFILGHFILVKKYIFDQIENLIFYMNIKKIIYFNSNSYFYPKYSKSMFLISKKELLSLWLIPTKKFIHT